MKCKDDKRHYWKDGWICEKCGLLRVDYEKQKRKKGESMKESEYIIATNRVKISSAIHQISTVIAGDNYGITKKEKTDIINQLEIIESKLFFMINELEMIDG